MSISFYNFNELHTPELRESILKDFAQIMEHNSYVDGEFNKQFESDFAKMQGAKHALLVANGTDALEICLSAYGVGPGDKVGIPGISFFATAECVINVGATPVFIDVDSQTGLMDPQSLRRTLEKIKLKAIIPVHIYGQPAPIEELEKICSPLKIKIIEDAAQAQGGFYQNKKPIGSSNNLVTFSFYPTKNLGAFGDAGAILTQDDQLKEKILSIRNHGRSPDGHALIGRNSRADHFQACVLVHKLKLIDEQNQKRKEVAKKYIEGLKDTKLRLPMEKFVELSSWHLFAVGLSSVEEKLSFQEHMKKLEIGTNLFYEKSLPDEKPLHSYPGEKEKAIHFANTTICLPLHPFLSDEDISQVIAVTRKFFS